MASYKDIKASCPSRNKYADGGRVASSRQGAKTVINVVVPPSAPGGGMPPPPVPMGNSPSPAGPAVPPAAAAMALGQMQGKPGMPGAFARGGRVKGGAASGVGRLQHEKSQKWSGK